MEIYEIFQPLHKEFGLFFLNYMFRIIKQASENRHRKKLNLNRLDLNDERYAEG